MLLLSLGTLSFGCGRSLEANHNRRGFYVASNAGPGANGSSSHPWDLATALAQPASVQPGDTIWLIGGRYTGTFESRLKGVADRPIVVREYPGERATIDGTLTVRGEHAVYWGFEVMNSYTVRTAREAGSDPAHYKRRAGIDIHGPFTRFVNLVVHDAGGGLGIWSDAEGSEIYGCLIFANGWQGPDRGHGHGIYGQNLNGVQRIRENVLFDQFGNGINLYGSDQAFLRNFELHGNISFNNGSLSADRSAIDILIGGGTPASGISVDSNFTYRTDGLLTARFGYDAAIVNDDLLLTGNYFVGQSELVNWQVARVTDNTFTGAQNVLQVTAPPEVSLKSYEWDRNTYVPDVRRRAMNSNMPIVAIENGLGTGYERGSWATATGHDTNGSSAAAPAGIHAVVRPNAYDPDRANIVVYNWSHKPTVQVDVSGILRTGDQYVLRAVTDYFGKPVAEGIFESGPLTIPMTVFRSVHTVGRVASPPPAIGGEFGVFVLIRR